MYRVRQKRSDRLRACLAIARQQIPRTNLNIRWIRTQSLKITQIYITFLSISNKTLRRTYDKFIDTFEELRKGIRASPNQCPRTGYSKTKVNSR